MAQFSKISQPVSFQTVRLGDSATVECYIESDLKKRVWYKVTTTMSLQLVAEFHSRYDHVLRQRFDQRYSVKLDGNSSQLSISEATWNDVGTYFCGVVYLTRIHFGSGTFLMLEGIHALGY